MAAKSPPYQVQNRLPAAVEKRRENLSRRVMEQWLDFFSAYGLLDFF